MVPLDMGCILLDPDDDVVTTLDYTRIHSPSSDFWRRAICNMSLWRTED